MLLGAVLVEHLAEASEGRARGLADHDLGVAESALDERPEGLEVGLDEERAALDDDAKGGDGRLAHRRVRRRGELLHLREQWREHLRWRQRRRERVDHAERGTCRNVLLCVDGLVLGSDRKQCGDDGAGEVELLDDGLLPANSGTGQKALTANSGVRLRTS